MRRLLAFTVLTLALAGCGDPDAGKLFADFQYGTRCPTSNHCEGPEDRDICGINNGQVCEGAEGTTRASCTLTEDGMGNFLLNFSVDQGLGFAMSVTQATVPMAGGTVGGASCGVRVVEGVNVYNGDCISQRPVSSSDPAMSVPGCQLTNVLFRLVDEIPTIEGQIECRDIPNQSNRDLKLDVRSTGTSPDDFTMPQPGRFSLQNCQGLAFEGMTPVVAP